MLLLGHIGITLGLALGAERALRRRALFLSRSEQVREAANPSPPAPGPSRLASAAPMIDYRLVLLGSILPDIIDKPASFLLPVDGRVLGHSLLFFLIVLLVGLYRYSRSGRSGILVLSICSGFHIILDKMWLMPQILLWPLYGLAFPRCDVTMTGWLTIWLETLQTEPAVFMPEIMGAFIMILFMVELLRSRSLLSFLRNGMVQNYTASCG